MTPHWCQLYQTRPDYRKRWDENGGPGQIVRREPAELRTLPPLREQVTGFLKAMAKFASDGFRVVDDEEFERRVGICMECELFIRRSGRCAKCGCKARLKAKGKIFTCPKELW